ncbi:Fumarate reductase flavoprotein subunit [bacterium HR23]|nr:Fumarate reductase flavoprotein subunit [bacterium HR23]
MANEVYCDVVVVGAGNAALSAAVSAAEHGARVIVLEKAPKELRGGNTYFTGDMRFPWDRVEDLLPLLGEPSEAEVRGLREQARPYRQADFWDDIMRVTEGRADQELAQVLVTQAYPTIRWMAAKGHRWVPSYATPGASMAVALNGGGAQLSEHWFSVAERLGVDIRYQHQAEEILRNEKGRCIGVRALTPEGITEVRGKAVILACGGFEANAAMRNSYLGPGWDLVKVRGVPFNTGDGLRMALDIGAWPYGHWSGCHSTPQDLNRPPYSLRVGASSGEFSRYAYPYGILVNIYGQRFVDEGEDLRPYTYAKMGRAIVAQPKGIAFQIFDRKVEHLLRGYDRATGARAASLSELAHLLGIDPQGLVRTVQEFNSAVQPGPFNPRERDGKCTRGLAIPKSNWAQTIDEPPFYGYAVVCGITFTFGGLRINPKAQVIHTSDRPIPGLYACGEIVGGLWYFNYPGGSGMTAGATFGRIAGREAAREALG